MDKATTRRIPLDWGEPATFAPGRILGWGMAAEPDAVRTLKSAPKNPHEPKRVRRKRRKQRKGQKSARRANRRS